MIDKARSGYYPQLGVGLGYAITDNPPQAFMMELNQRSLNMADPAFDPNQPEDTQNIRFSTTARLRVLDGRRKAGVQMARSGRDAARAQLAAARNRLIHEVTRGYYRVLQAQALTGVQKERVASLDESLRVSRERFAAGTAVKTDVLNIEVELAQAAEDLVRARNGVRLAVAALNTAIGTDRVPESGLPDPGDPVEGTPPGPEAGDIESRPELEAVRNARAAGEASYRKARREHLPVISAFGSLDWDSETLSDAEQSYLAGVMLEWDAFTGHRRSATVAQARDEWQAAVAEEQDALNVLRLDLRQAHIQWSEAWERLSVTRKSVESAEESLRITQDRYQEGAAAITDLLVAQTGLTALRTRHIAAYYDCRIAHSNVKRARGVLVQEYEEGE